MESQPTPTRNLRIPGPTPVPPQVLEALARPVIGHRGLEAQALLARLQGKLQHVFQTRHDVLIFTASGTGGMEAAIANLLSPGDRVLVASVGVFGERWVQISEAYRAQVDVMRYPHGMGFVPEEVAEHIRRHGPYRALFVTHNETSTGVTNDLAGLARALAPMGDSRPLLVVDAISSLAAIDLQTDAWGCDVVVTGSQKALMTPPGLALVSVSPRALGAAEKATNPRFYWDFRRMREYAQERRQTPFTPAVSLLQALDVALDLLLAEGLQNAFRRHQELAEFFRNGAAELGFSFLAQPPFRSNAVTTLLPPEGITAEAIIRRLREEFAIEVAGGQGPLKGKVVRVGHMGWVTREDLQRVLDGLRQILRQ